MKRIAMILVASVLLVGCGGEGENAPSNPITVDARVDVPNDGGLDVEVQSFRVDGVRCIEAHIGDSEVALTCDWKEEA